MKSLLIELVKMMDKAIMETGDEDIYEVWWMDGVPNEPTEDDFEWFAENPDELADLTNLFCRLMKSVED